MPTRLRYEMPDLFRNALNARRLLNVHLARPPYQQNDTIGSLRVTRAKLETIKQKRLNQMLDEMEWQVGRAFSPTFFLCGKIEP